MMLSSETHIKINFSFGVKYIFYPFCLLYCLVALISGILRLIGLLGSSVVTSSFSTLLPIKVLRLSTWNLGSGLGSSLGLP